MNGKILFRVTILRLQSWVVEEYGHYLAVKYYKGTPLFSFYRKTTTFYITPFEGEDFYWNLYEQVEKTTWIKQIVISGAGLFAFLLLGMVFSIAGPFIYSSGSLFLGVLVAPIGLFNLLVFFANWKNKTSDGYKINCALKHKENYVAYLKSIDHRFILENCVEEVEHVRNKYLRKSTDLS